MAHSPETAKLLAEALGTFMLVFTIGCNVLSNNAVWGGVSIGTALSTSIYAFGNISGANFNPAVSVALSLVHTMGGNGIPWRQAGLYICVQIVAGIVAGIGYTLLFHKGFNLAPGSGYSLVHMGICESLYTFMLCFVVLNVAAARKYTKEPNEFYGLAIGFVVIAGAYSAGAVSGGCFNPAVAIAIDVCSAGLHAAWCLLYVVFQLLGASVAAVLFRLVRPEDFEAGGTGTTHSLTSKLTSEFLGTFMLVLTVGLNVLGKSPAAVFSIAASLTSMIYAVGDISGAHFNPAVTTAILTSRQDESLTPTVALSYMLTQLIAGVGAGFTFSAVHHWQSFTLGPQRKYGYGWAEVAVGEIVFTFVLCYIVLCVAVCERTKSMDMFGLSIGACVTVGGLAIGGISGGSLNPAVSIGIAAPNSLASGTAVRSLIYIALEMVGGAAAAGVLRATHSPHGYKESETDYWLP